MQHTLEGLNEKMLWNSIKESPRLACFLGDLPAQSRLTQDGPLDIAEADILFKTNEAHRKTLQDSVLSDNSRAMEHEANEEPLPIAAPGGGTPSSTAPLINAISLEQKTSTPLHDQETTLGDISISPAAPKVVALHERVIAPSTSIDGASYPAEASKQPQVPTSDVKPPASASALHMEPVTQEETRPLELNLQPAPTPELAEKSESTHLPMGATQPAESPSPLTQSETITGASETAPLNASDAPSTPIPAAKQASRTTRHGFSSEARPPEKNNLVWGIAALTAVLVLLTSIMMTWSTISQNFDFSTLGFKSNQPQTGSPAMAVNNPGATPPAQGAAHSPTTSPQPDLGTSLPDTETTQTPLIQPPPEKRGTDNHKQESPHEPPTGVNLQAADVGKK